MPAGSGGSSSSQALPAQRTGPRPAPRPAPPCSKYVDHTLEHCRRNFKTVVPLPPINQVQTLCKVGAGGRQARVL